MCKLERLTNQVFKAAKNFGCVVTRIEAEGSNVRATCNYGGIVFVFSHTEGTVPADIVLDITKAYNQAVNVLRANSKV